MTKIYGTYTHKNTIVMALIAFVLFMLFCAPAPFLNNEYHFMALMWFAVFMQGFLDPVT